MEALIIGVAAGFNFLIIKWKLQKERYEDAAVDIAILACLSLLFGGTLGGMIIATIGSAMVSLAFIVSPPTFITGFLAEFKRRVNGSKN